MVVTACVHVHVKILTPTAAGCIEMVAVKSFVFVLILLLCSAGASAIRLPLVGDDDGLWGELLNVFLNVSLANDGTLRSNIVISDTILDGSIEQNDLADNSVGSEQILDGSISEADMGVESITAQHISQNAIADHNMIADGIITGSDIAFDTIAGVNIKNGSISSSKLIPGSINEASIDPEAALDVASVEANMFFISMETVTASCSTPGCTATALCNGARNILYGMSSTSSSFCDTNPSQCSAYCDVAPDDGCSATASDSNASAYIVCAQIS
jgi:hypothetical protein